MVKVKKRGTQGLSQGPSQGPSQSKAGPLPDAERFAFLQALMHEKFMTESRAKEIFIHLADSSKKRASYRETVAQINEGVGYLLMELRTVTFPVDKQRYIGLVNKENDEVAKNNGSAFSIPQIQYLRAVIEQIAIDPNAEDGAGSLSSTNAYNMNFSSSYMSQQATQSSQVDTKRLNLTEKDNALKLFVKEGWLSQTPDQQGYYSLGARTFLELTDLLLEFNLPAATRKKWEELL